MRWSKMKQRIEAGFAPSLRGRVAVHITRYRKAHHVFGEVWITLDKNRIHVMGEMEFWNAFGDMRTPLTDDWDAAEAELRRSDKMELCDFNAAMFDYLNMSIDDVLASDRTIIRAFGMFDARLGKRRLRALDMDGEAPLVARFHAIRCEAEGLTRTAPAPEHAKGGA